MKFFSKTYFISGSIDISNPSLINLCFLEESLRASLTMHCSVLAPHLLWVSQRRDAPEGMHKMAEATMHHQFPESHNMPAKPQFAHVMPAKPGSVFVMPAMPESPAKMATTPADAPLWPGLIASVLDPPLVSVRAAGIPRSAALSAPEPAPSQELAESGTPGSLLVPSGSPESLLGPSGAPEPAPSQELAESAPEPAPSQELAESGTPGSLLVPSGSPESLLVPSGSPEPLLAPPSSPSSLVPSSLALSERPRDSAPPECPLEVVVFPKEIVLGGATCLRSHLIHHGCPRHRIFYGHLENSLPRSLRLYVLSLSLVSVSSRSQSLPWVSAPPWRAPVSSAPPWRAPVSSAPPWRAPVSSAPPWWAPVSSAPPWWAPVSSAPPWWAPVSSAPPWWVPVSSAPPWWVPVSSAPPWWAAGLPESPHVSAGLPQSPHATAVYPVSLHVSSAPPWWAPVSLAPHGPGPLFPPPVPPPLHRPPGLCRVWSVWKPLFGGGLCHESGCHSPHYSCTSPMDYNSHHSLHLQHTHSHPPLHQSLINPDCLTTPAPHSHTHI